jgi:hypothetical protein
MSTTYSGNPASGAQSPAIQITRPSDGDALNAASINATLQKIADYIAFLQAHVALIDVGQSFTAAQAFLDAIQLSKSGDQSIFKYGSGALEIGTLINSDLGFKTNGVTRAVLRASDGRIGSLADPVQNQDADTMAARNAAITAGFNISTAAITPGSNWSGAQSIVKKSGRTVTVIISAMGGVGASWGSVANVPAGFRPGADWGWRFRGAIINYTGPGHSYDADISIESNGNVSVVGYDSGTEYAPPFTIANSVGVLAFATYLAEN